MDDGIVIVDVEYDSKDDMEELLVNGQKHTHFEVNGLLGLLVTYM